MAISHQEIIRADQHDEFREWSRDHQDYYVHYISLLTPPRPGALTFLTAMEYYHFPPGTPLNLVFESHSLELIPDTTFNVMSFPKAHRPLALKLARLLGLVLRRGAPMVVTPDGVEHHFPIVGPHVYWTENIVGHPVKKDLALYDIAHQREFDLVNRIQRGERPNLSTFMQTIYA
jgi:hypothetical protein